MSRLRIVWLVFAGLWLVLIPVFGANASHFGWGFFPMVATVFFVPVATFGLTGDFLVNVFLLFSNPETRKRRAILAGVNLALLVPYVLVFAGLYRG